jgi:hypothetical protein
MQVACPSCANVLTVPPEKAAVPNLKAKCRCGTVFAVTGEAPSAPPPPPPPRVAPAATDRVAAIRAANAAAASSAAAAPTPRAAVAPAVKTAAEAAPPRPHSVPVPWRRCQNHPQARSEFVCPNCTKGLCGACPQMVQTAAICPFCEGLCVAAAAYEESLEKTRQRTRSMMDEVGVIAGYPLRDTMAFVLLALFTWFFGLFSGFSFFMVLLSKGVLTWYSFNAVSKVAIGNLRDVMPDFRDLSDIGHALRLSLAALVVSLAPLLLCFFLVPGADLVMQSRPGRDRRAAADLEIAHAQPPASSAHHSPFEAEPEGPGSMAAPLAILAIVLSVIWLVVYMPVALTVAALSKSILSTINPVIGIDTIKKMGGTYWQALAIYGVLVVGQVVLGWGLRLIPFAGGLAASFVDAYFALAVGCTLGMAVFKKAVELGWD